MVKHCLGTLKLTRYQSKQSSFITFFRTKAKAYAFNLTVRADHIHSQSEIVFNPEKLTFSISSWHTTTCKRPGS